MASLKIINKKLICIDDKIETLIESVINKSLQAVSDIRVQVAVPPGVEYVSSNLGQGTYNSSSNIWTIGTMTKGQSFSGDIIWKVTDDCLAPFKFTFTLSSSSSSVCIGDTNSHCILIDGITKCQLDRYKGIRTIVFDETLALTDYTILADASSLPVNITLPPPADVYKVFPDNTCNNGGKEYHIKVIDLTNPVTLTTPSGKIVDFSTIANATATYSFSLVGQTVVLHSNGENYFIKTI